MPLLRHSFSFLYCLLRSCFILVISSSPTYLNSSASTTSITEVLPLFIAIIPWILVVPLLNTPLFCSLSLQFFYKEFLSILWCVDLQSTSVPFDPFHIWVDVRTFLLLSNFPLKSFTSPTVLIPYHYLCECSFSIKFFLVDSCWFRYILNSHRVLLLS